MQEVWGLIRMTFKFKIRKKARKFIDKQDAVQRKRIMTAIYALPFIGDVSKVEGYENLYRLRVGDFRILFSMDLINETFTLINVTDAGNRGQIYDRY